MLRYIWGLFGSQKWQGCLNSFVNSRLYFTYRFLLWKFTRTPTWSSQVTIPVDRKCRKVQVKSSMTCIFKRGHSSECSHCTFPVEKMSKSACKIFYDTQIKHAHSKHSFPTVPTVLKLVYTEHCYLSWRYFRLTLAVPLKY